MKKTFRKLLAICLVMMLAFAVALPASAANVPAPLTKRVMVAGGLTPPAMSYIFEFTPELLQDSTTELSPDLNNGTANTADDNLISIAYTGSESISGTSGGYNYYDKTEADVLANTVFPHAGVYHYTVVENGTITPPSGTITYSLAKYDLAVYVKNAGTGLEISEVVFTRIEDDKGIADGTKQPMLFTNTYTSDTILVVSNELVGNYADLTKDFTYTIDIAGALTATVDARYTKADGSSVMVTVDASMGTFTLKHGESLTFESLPTGAFYTLTQTGEAGYTPKATITTAAISGEVETGAAGATIAVGVAGATNSLLKTPIYLQTGTNTAEWENSYDDSVNTGVIMNVLPFIILIVVAVGGFVGYLAMRRRKLNHR